MKPSLPPAWVKAFARDQAPETILLADPAPERRIARLLGAFIAAGIVFLVFPGTLVGVWNLLRISFAEQGGRAPVLWVQAHGHAQLFGWVATFMAGICLYAVPKFRGGMVRSVALGWLMFALWTAATLTRWASALWLWHWQLLLPLAAGAQLAVAVLLIWQTTASGKSRPPRLELWNLLVHAGLLGFAGTMLLQLVVLVRLASATAPVIPPGPNHWLLNVALWLFCFPVAWGFSSRFLPTFLGLGAPRRSPAIAGLSLLWLAPLVELGGSPALARLMTLAAVLLACFSLRVFEPPARPAKTLGVDPRFPVFVRLAFGWLAVSALLYVAAVTPGLEGAGRHAFTVGFLALLIFSIGPRILPSFLNSRELWSPRLMLWALLILTTGCALRVLSEPLAYSNVVPLFWRVLPVSGLLELSAVLLFAFNIARTLATPMPAWFAREQLRDSMTLYWYVTAYPATRRLLIDAGLKTLTAAHDIPKSLSLREAAEADGVDSGVLLEKLAEFFEARLARPLRRQR